MKKAGVLDIPSMRGRCSGAEWQARVVKVRGNTGTELAARATPDGYTMIIDPVGPIAVNPTLYREPNINPLTGLVPVVQMAGGCCSPARSLPPPAACSMRRRSPQCCRACSS